VPIPVEFGNSHFESLAEKEDPPFVSECDPVQMGRHDGVAPEFYLAGIRLESKDIGDVSNVLIVPEKDFIVGGDAEMVELFHSFHLFVRKIRKCHFSIKT